MRKFIFMVLFFFLETGFLHCQFSFIESLKQKSYVYFFGGANQVKMEDLNRELDKFGYPEFEDPFYSYGIGYCYNLSDNFEMRLAGRKYLYQSENSHTRKMKLGAEWLYAEAQFGWAFFKNKNSELNLLFGIGVEDVCLKIYDSEKTVFDSLLSNPQRGVEFLGHNIELSLSLGGDFFIGPLSPSTGSGLILGLNFGYRHTPYNFPWNTPVYQIEDGPKMDLGGAYLEFISGWGKL